MEYPTIVTALLISIYVFTGPADSTNNGTASFQPEKQTIRAEACRPVVMTLGANINISEAAVRIEKFNPHNFDYYYLFYKRSGDRRIRENKKSGSLGHYPRYKPSYQGTTLQFTISHVVEEDEGMYLISIKTEDATSWFNSYVTLVVDKEPEDMYENQVPSISSKLKMEDDLVTENYDLEPDVVKMKDDQFCDFFIIAGILLVLGLAGKVALVYYLWRTKKELNRMKRQSQTSLDRKELLRESDQAIDYQEKTRLA